MTFSSDNPLRFRNDLEQNNDIKKNRQRLLIRKRTKEINLRLNKLGADDKYHEKLRNVLQCLPIEQVEKYVEFDKSVNPEDIVYRKHIFNRYGTIMSF